MACRLLGDCVDTVSLFEPMDVMTLPTDEAPALVEIATFFSRTREGLLRDGRAASKHAGGIVPDNPFGPPDALGRRTPLVAPGWIEVPRPSPDFTMVVKHNAAFAALLPELASRFETYAVVRNPVAALGSWWSLDLPVSRGRAPAGERLDPSLQARLDACATEGERQLILMDWFFARFATLPPERVLRYEDIVASSGAALYAATGLVPRICPQLESRNASRDYPLERDPRTVDALLEHEGAWTRWYDRDELARVAGARNGIAGG
ncbi:hypothetical protein PAGU2595_003300 [Lysobacter xanthus]